MEERVTGLRFIPDKRFEEMFKGLQSLISISYKGIFFLDASKEATKKMKYHACLGSNKLNGWIIPKEKVEDFEQLFYQNRDLADWDAYKTSVWAWNDTEGYRTWLYSFEGAIFEETVIE
ncbi:MAG: hypothetical protein HDQ95_04790 [Roseburia sp.]|nr:hypothetical protein [Roseburia sp.]